MMAALSDASSAFGFSSRLGCCRLQSGAHARVRIMVRTEGVPRGGPRLQRSCRCQLASRGCLSWPQCGLRYTRWACRPMPAVCQPMAAGECVHVSGARTNGLVELRVAGAAAAVGPRCSVFASLVAMFECVEQGVCVGTQPRRAESCSAGVAADFEPVDEVARGLAAARVTLCSDGVRMDWARHHARQLRHCRYHMGSGDRRGVHHATEHRRVRAVGRAAILACVAWAHATGAVGARPRGEERIAHAALLRQVDACTELQAD